MDNIFFIIFPPQPYPPWDGVEPASSKSEDYSFVKEIYDSALESQNQRPRKLVSLVRNCTSWWILSNIQNDHYYV